MGSRVLQHEKLTNTLALSKCTDGYWLYDQQASINTAMHCKTERDAFISTIEYYQRWVTNLQKTNRVLRKASLDFVENVAEELEIDHIL